MATIAVWSVKGGTAKTSVALNLGAALAERRRKVLLLDLDPIGCLLRVVGRHAHVGLSEALLGERSLSSMVAPTEFAGLHAISACPELHAADVLRAERRTPERLLAEALDRLEAGRFDDVVLDCGPGVNLLTLLALAGADLHLAPTDPDALTIGSVPATLDLAETVRKRLNPGLRPTRILLSRVGRAPASQLACEALRDRFAEALLHAEIPERSAMAEATASFEPVLTFEPDDAATEAFRALAEEVLEGMP